MSAASDITDTEKLRAEIAKMMAEASKANAEALKISRETFWYPVAIASGLIGAVAAATTVIIKFL